MSLKDLFLIFKKNDYEKELKSKLISLELNIEELKKSLLTSQQQAEGKTKDPPIIIEKINIEKIILDKYELNNNFGQLGIKELKGKLNIGATYGSEFTPNIDEEMKKPKSSGTERNNEPKKNLKVNIKAKKD
jgi:septum formation inhibitor MinC